MNRLWKASCGDKELLIKEFSRKRFEKKQLKEIDQALKRQLAVKKLGIPCPYLYTWKGHVIRFLADGTAYMVMDFCCGKKEDSKTVILSQLESLGEICALMHKEFSTLSVKGVNGFPIERGKLLSSLRENDTAHKQCFAHTTHLNIKRHCWPKGQYWNISQINFSFGFQRASVMRTLHLTISCFMNTLDIEKIRALPSGYSRRLPFTLSNAINALRVTWRMESL